MSHESTTAARKCKMPHCQKSSCATPCTGLTTLQGRGRAWSAVVGSAHRLQCCIFVRHCSYICIASDLVLSQLSRNPTRNTKCCAVTHHRSMPFRCCVSIRSVLEPRGTGAAAWNYTTHDLLAGCCGFCCGSDHRDDMTQSSSIARGHARTLYYAMPVLG